MEYVAKVAWKVNISLKDIMIILKDILVQIRKPSETLLVLKNLQIILETALKVNIPPEQIKNTLMDVLKQKGLFLLIKNSRLSKSKFQILTKTSLQNLWIWEILMWEKI